jgi:hypothetical protein
MKRLTVLAILLLALPASAAEWPKAEKVEAQPLIAQAKRIGQALELLGQPLPKEAKDALDALKESDGTRRWPRRCNTSSTRSASRRCG